MGKINPYHFVPVLRDARRSVPVAGFEQGEPAHLFHERFVPGTWSGRLLCRLVTETPIFIGAERKPGGNNESATIAPFELDGEPALPASSLRGLISSVAETASNSALRVLEDRVFSYRRQAREALPAVGEVLMEKGVDGKPTYQLRPLAAPPLERAGQHFARLPKAYRALFPHPNLRVYIGDLHTIKDPEFPPTYDPEKPRFYGLQLRGSSSRAPLRWQGDFELPAGILHWRKGELAISQEALDPRSRPIPWDEISDAERARYTRGIVRTLSAPDRDLPNTKKHELFIPYDPEVVAGWPTIPIPSTVIERFHQLADERTAASEENAARAGALTALPFHPRGTQRKLDAESDDLRFRLKAGDLVYFRPSEDGSEVAEIALSAIWRGRVEDKDDAGMLRGASAHVFFASIDPELLPHGPGRTTITHAEQLFGFAPRVGSGKTRALPALASRVRFSFGRLVPGSQNPRLPETTLRALLSPKPPSPALYFFHRRNPADREPIGKSKLNPKEHAPQGRKVYLHQKADPQTQGPPPWKTADPGNLPQLKSRVRPLRDNLTFYFHVDFENLRDDDLGLLLYALRPTERFRHKLGMGKPIGLGTVRIEPCAFFEVDRERRYTAEGFFAERWARIMLRPGQNPEEWPERLYARERAAAGRTASFEALETLKGRYRETIPPAIRGPLELLGEKILPPRLVSVPLVAGGDPEKETFKWFQENERQQGTSLEPLRAEGNQIPQLPEPPRGQMRGR